MLIIVMLKSKFVEKGIAVITSQHFELRYSSRKKDSFEELVFLFFLF